MNPGQKRFLHFDFQSVCQNFLLCMLVSYAVFRPYGEEETLELKAETSNRFLHAKNIYDDHPIKMRAPKLIQGAFSISYHNSTCDHARIESYLGYI